MASRGWRQGLTLLLVTGLVNLAGCFGMSANPRSFPYYLPPGDIIETHAKPAGRGYYANFDPHAVRVEVRPLSAVNPVGTQHVVLATVYDAAGIPRRNRRVEWILEGAGSIVEVDESGCSPGRGYKLDNKYAVSYTNYCNHTMTRGNLNPGDDFVLRPGQTWCVISSATEGDTYVSAYVPGIFNWEKRKVTVNCRWVDATWVFPGPAAERAGTQHVFTTRLFRYSDKQALANYKVRYTILDGPPAVLMPSRVEQLLGPTATGTHEAVVVSGLDGAAEVTIAQPRPVPGANRVSIEVIRPPDPTAPSGVGIVLAKAETVIEWLAPQVALNLTAPPTAPVGGEIPYTITLTNTGKVEAAALTVSDTAPPELEFVRSDIPHSVVNQSIFWTLGNLPPGQSRSIQAVFRALKSGEVINCAEVEVEDGELRSKDRKCVSTQVTQPGLQLNMTGPATAVVGQPIGYQITVANSGNGPAENVVLAAHTDPGLEHTSKANPIYLNLGTLAPSESKVLPLTLTARQMGQLTVTVNGKADGGLTAQTSWTVTVTEPKMSLKLTGPQSRPVEGQAEWNIRVQNIGAVPLSNVIVRQQLPPQLKVERTPPGAVVQNGEIVWDVGVLPAGREQVLQLLTRVAETPGVVSTTATATSEFGLKLEDRANLSIYGVSGLEFEANDEDDPLLVGKQTVYQIKVKNTGSAAVKDIEVRGILPKEMRFIGGQGPGALPRQEGQKVIFGKVDAIEPQQELIYRITVEAAQHGDVIFRAEMNAGSQKEPIISDEATTIVDPLSLRNGNGNGAAPPKVQEQRTPPGLPPQPNTPAAPVPPVAPPQLNPPQPENAPPPPPPPPANGNLGEIPEPTLPVAPSLRIPLE